MGISGDLQTGLCQSRSCVIVAGVCLKPFKRIPSLTPGPPCWPYLELFGPQISRPIRWQHTMICHWPLAAWWGGRCLKPLKKKDALYISAPILLVSGTILASNFSSNQMAIHDDLLPTVIGLVGGTAPPTAEHFAGKSGGGSCARDRLASRLVRRFPRK